MAMVRYTAYPLGGLQQQINRIFDQFDSEIFGSHEGLGGGMFAPAVDVKEDCDAYIVHVEVPGVKQENINISLQDNTLTIRGAKEQTEKSEGQFRRVERSYGSFARSLSLPRTVDGNAVVANLEDGVLEVRLPKLEAVKPRTISVGATRDTNALDATTQQTEGATQDNAPEGHPS